MTRWITFERFVNELTRILEPDARGPRFPTTRWLAQLEVLDRETLSEIDFIRRLRNDQQHKASYGGAARLYCIPGRTAW